MFNSVKKNLALAIALGFSATGAQAAVEDLTSDNGSYLTAQNIGDLSSQTLINVFGFRGNVFNGAIIDNSDADFYSFQITSPATLTLNVFTPEGSTYGNDPILGLFDSSGVQLTNDDDSGAGYDAYIQWVITAPGTYYAAVSGFADFDFLTGGSTNYFYNLQAEVSAAPAAVPVPAAAWLMGSALLGLTALGRKRSV